MKGFALKMHTTILVVLLYLNMAIPFSRWQGQDSGNDFLNTVIRGSDIGLFMYHGWLIVPTTVIFAAFPAPTIWSWVRTLNTGYGWWKLPSKTLRRFLPLLPFFLFDHLLLSFSLPIFAYLLLTDSKTPKKPLYLWYWLNSIIAAFQVISGRSVGLLLMGESYLRQDLRGLARLELFDTKILRGYGLTPHPNILAVLGVIGLISIPRTSKHRIAAYLAIILSFSRAGLIGLIIYEAIYYIQKYKTTQTFSLDMFKIKTWLHACVSGAGAVFLSLISIRSSDSYRLENLHIWFEWLRQSSLSEKVFGTGLGQYSFAIKESFPNLEVWKFEPVHNTFLLLVAELGLTLSIFFGILIAVLSYKKHKNKNNPQHVATPQKPIQQ